MKQGSYTVEAALLMGLLIPLLAGLLYLGFFLKGRGEVYGEALEKTLTTALVEETGEGVSLDEGEITASVRRTLPTFPFGDRFFQIPGSVEGSCTLERQNPARMIFRLHSMKKVIRQVKRR